MPAVILYDGVCGLCQRLVRFVLKRDRRRAFRFAALQSDVARRVLNTYGRDPSDLDTFYLVLGYGTQHERLEDRSRAVLDVCARLGGLWPLVLVLRLVPSIIADAVYSFVARRRYRWFGRDAVCPVPPPELRARFLDASLDDRLDAGERNRATSQSP